jgi:hypothetical protein
LQTPTKNSFCRLPTKFMTLTRLVKLLDRCHAETSIRSEDG